MSRSAAKHAYADDNTVAQTAKVESCKDQTIGDEIPGAYKAIHSAIDAQKDLVDVVERLRAVLCVKG